MQLVILALVIGVILHEQLGPAAIALDLAGALGLWLAAPLTLALAYWAACGRALRQLNKGKGVGTIRRLDRIAVVFRVGLLIQYAAALYLGVLTGLRHATGLTHWVLVDELLFMLPTAGSLVWAWWAYYPVDRRLRDASLLARLDAGLPVHPVLTRGQYVLMQSRHQAAMIGAPLLILMTWQEIVHVAVPSGRAIWGIDPQYVLLLVGSGGVFLLAPVMMRHIWDTTPLPPGLMRDRLIAMCRQHHVGIRELLLWRTFGGMINAAVMGLIKPVRYILVTDGLLETVPQRQVEAVMAHELAHIRRHHILWLLVTAIGTLQAAWLVWAFLVERLLIDAIGAIVAGLAMSPESVHTLQQPTSLQMVALTGAGLTWMLVFGWVSRRFERQADTFAVQHLTRQRREEMAAATSAPADLAAQASPAADATLTADADDGNAPANAAPLVIDSGSVAAMIQALQAVADLNNIRTHRHSWRHGSITWRQNYLRTLVGMDADRLPIDRLVTRVNCIALAALVIGIALDYLQATGQL